MRYNLWYGFISVSTAGLAPVRGRSEQGTASIPAVYRPSNMDLAQHLYWAHQKSGIPPPEDVAMAAEKNRRQVLEDEKSYGTEPARPDESYVEYLSPVDIGTPPQRVNLVFDTGSSDLWVFSPQLPPEQINGQRLYDPARSKTASRLEEVTWEVGYGDGDTAQGVVYTDVVTVGDITAAAQAVEVSRNVSTALASDNESSGILGLSLFPTNHGSPVEQKTWLYNILPNLTQGLFTVNFNYKSDGNFNFGYIDPEEYTGNITYTPVDDTYGSWLFNASGYKVGDKPFQSQPLFAKADTGTTLLLLPEDVAKSYYAEVGSGYYDSQQPGFVFDCDETLPDFSFGINGTVFTIPGRYLKRGSTRADKRKCTGAIQKTSGEYALFGCTALQVALVVFDVENVRLGWALKDLV